MPSLVPSPKFPTFPTYKISIPLLLFLVCFGESYLNPITKVKDFSDNPLSYSAFILFWKWIFKREIYRADVRTLYRQEKRGVFTKKAPILFGERAYAFMEKVGINGIEDRHEWTKSMRFLLFPLDCLYYLSYFCGQTHTHKTWKIS